MLGNPPYCIGLPSSTQRFARFPKVLTDFHRKFRKMKKYTEKMCPHMEDTSSSPFPEKLIPIKLDVRYPPIQPRRGRPRPVTFGGSVQRMLGRLGRLLCLSTSRPGDGDEDEEYLQYLERTVTYLQSSNRILAVRLNSMAEKVEVAAKQKQDDAATLEAMRHELNRVSSENDRVRSRCEETAHQLEHNGYFMDHLKLFDRMKDEEISDLKASCEEFKQANKERLVLIDELKEKQTEMRSQVTLEEDDIAVEQSEEREGLHNAATEEQQQGQPHQQHVADEAAPRRRRIRRGGVKHRRSKTSHSTQQTPRDDQALSEQ